LILKAHTIPHIVDKLKEFEPRRYEISYKKLCNPP